MDLSAILHPGPFIIMNHKCNVLACCIKTAYHSLQIYIYIYRRKFDIHVDALHTTWQWWFVSERWHANVTVSSPGVNAVRPGVDMIVTGLTSPLLPTCTWCSWGGPRWRGRWRTGPGRTLLQGAWPRGGARTSGTCHTPTRHAPRHRDTHVNTTEPIS